MLSDTSTLASFLPEGMAPKFLDILQKNQATLKITKDRKSKFGDYRWPTKAHPFHRISVNGTLNPYAFMTTLIHEIAHMLTRIQFDKNVTHHSKEWKACYGNLLRHFAQFEQIPQDLRDAWIRHSHNPKASTVGDAHLFRILNSYNITDDNGKTYLSELEPGDFFSLGKKLFRFEKKRRTKILSKDLDSKRMYLVHHLAEVQRIELPNKEKVD